MTTAQDRYEILEKLDQIGDRGPTLHDALHQQKKGKPKVFLSDVQKWNRMYDGLCDRAVEVIARGDKYDMARLRADVDRMLGSASEIREDLDLSHEQMCDAIETEGE